MGRIKPAALLLQSKRRKGPPRFSVTTIAACNAFIILFLLSTVFMVKHKGKQQSKVEDDLMIQKTVVDVVGGSSQYAVLNTTRGLVTLQLHAKQAPKGVADFVTHSQNGDYNGSMFYQVIKGFMILGGYRGEGDGTGGRRKFMDAFGSGVKHEPFTLFIASDGPDANGSQFLITTVGTLSLNDKHAIEIGRVVRGQEVVQDIESSPTDSSDRPLAEIMILSVHIEDSL